MCPYFSHCYCVESNGVRNSDCLKYGHSSEGLKYGHISEERFGTSLELCGIFSPHFFTMWVVFGDFFKDKCMKIDYELIGTENQTEMALTKMALLLWNHFCNHLRLKYGHIRDCLKYGHYIIEISNRWFQKPTWNAFTKMGIVL